MLKSMVNAKMQFKKDCDKVLCKLLVMQGDIEFYFSYYK